MKVPAMPDSQPREPILVTYKDLAELMVKHKGIHHGLWGVYIRFGLKATNMPVQADDEITLMPAAILPIVEIGIQEFHEASALTVDAAAVNPKRKGKETKPSRRTAKKK